MLKKIKEIFNNDIKIKFDYKIPSQKDTSIELETGEKLTFKFDLDSEHENRGWIVNKITMYVDNIEAGYMKLSYIPKEHWMYFRGDIIKWSLQENNLYIKYNRSQNKSKFIHDNFETLEFKKEIILNNPRYVENYREMEEKKVLTDSEINNYYESLKNRLNKLYYKEYKNFEKYFVEKPLIDFSRIYDEHDTIQYSYSDLKKEKRKEYLSTLTKLQYAPNVIGEVRKEKNLEHLSHLIPKKYIKSFRGKGYSKYFYKVALDWVNLNNQCLYSGSLNVDSKRVWEKLKNSENYYEVKNPYKNRDNKMRRVLTNDEKLLKMNHLKNKSKILSNIKVETVSFIDMF